jgi:putative hemolysin
MGSASILARTFALTPLGRAYSQATSAQEPPDFSSRALDALGVSMDISDDQFRDVPAKGPLVVVANHPFGAIDGLVLLSLLARVRTDLKLLGNSLLRYVPQLRPSLIEVDVFARAGAVTRNTVAVRRAMRWLVRGGCVLLFPAGEVAHYRDCAGNAVDSNWQATAAVLASRASACVLPIFFSGCNSALFQAAGRIHPLLRTALLPREMWARRGTTVSVRVGPLVRPEELAAVSSARERTMLLRSRVEVLGRATIEPPAIVVPRSAPVAERGSVADIENDVAALQGDVLLESGNYQVFCASALQLPAILSEIGRLREIAFRQAGEGTGLARDLDRFDQTYQHLFVWDRDRHEIAGAYRLAATDVVARGARVDGLYTHTLFAYDRSLLDAIGPALELGRSFVQPYYQRDFSPLLLLWKGISRVVARAPRYRRLFGVVSISDRYDSTSRALMLKFLQTRRFDAELGRLVRAKNPPPPPPRDVAVQSAIVDNLDQVSGLVRRIEADGKDIPVLLRQYLKLNAKLLGFTVDPSFGNVLDGLVIVDLADVEPALLARYMGREESTAFLRSASRFTRAADCGL